mmetsp:Transcript_16133/g.33765  ORF Transcript_16133/g.33765 Transcript_16133/m.33765 type:complete len:234 (+) Transcript_16133:812-1513(+)
MVIATTGDMAGKDDAGGVDRLKYARVIDPPGDFFDENGCQSLGTEFFVHAEEVDFDHGLFRLVDADGGGHGGDQGHEAVGFAGADSEVELLLVSRGSEGPHEEVAGVVEAEDAPIVFDVVLVEEVVHFVALGRVVDVDFGPFEAFGHVIGFLTEFGGGFVGDDRLVVVWLIGGAFFVKHWLRIPKRMFCPLLTANPLTNIPLHCLQELLHCRILRFSDRDIRIGRICGGSHIG